MVWTYPDNSNIFDLIEINYTYVFLGQDSQHDQQSERTWPISQT